MKIYIIGALIGAVIGYITNWLAIKMLFRPREAKYIFGMKLPFTPGLIPKEKSRIANKVGETVGTHLLNSDSLSKALKDDKIKAKFNEVAKEKINQIINSNSTLENSLKNTLGENYYALKGNMIDNIAKTILESIQEEEFKNKVKFYIVDSIKERLNKEPEKIIDFINSNKFREVIINTLEEEKTRDIIGKALLKEVKTLGKEDLTIEEVIPENIKPYIEEYVKSQKDTFVDIIKNLLRDDEVSHKIKSAINDNIPSIVSMFLSGDVIYGKLVSLVDKSLSEEENKEYICDAALAFVHESMKKKVSDVINNVGEEKLEVISDALGDKISKKLNTEENIDSIISKLNCKISSFNSYEEIIKVLFNDYENILIDNIDSMISQIVNNNQLSGEISKMIEKVFDKFLQNSLNDICYNKQNLENSIMSILDNLYNDFVENKSAKVLEIVDISSIVEEQINAFEVDYAEEIIIGIANKELKAITWLGALLGGILGILSPLLSTIYM
ncbi:DUF445 family protein [Clostridium perfringens]|uniref:DUF445 domain-containing protein n=4 Tax=Clostridium perfringens TaxID=1502 RepID=A0AAP8XBJ0_CLOPF|nr:DUF445 family protein [Clostridium perfringens]ABG83697.1 conserved hypothetical protein [Clostridium perfringens ATCC 13124]AMN34009.1 hypothetical protein JFP55_14355 [Clostridium perfringens]AQW28132.1 hypothetical protein BXT94_15750 [Clostridium perfringens]ASY52859.1 hypothetical protein BG908_14840 [Clostridium perfringens]AWS24445.1 DUF445 domain-containing protein [Clostridium perfringens]